MKKAQGQNDNLLKELYLVHCFHLQIRKASQKISKKQQFFSKK